MREEIKKIRDIVYGRMNSFVSVACYNRNGYWDDNYSIDQYRLEYSRLRESLFEIMTLDFWNSLTEEDLDDLMFGKWSSESNLRLIPIMYYDILPEGLEVTSLSGRSIVVDEYYQYSKFEDNERNPGYIDNDIRGGCLAYGIYPKDIRDTAVNNEEE